jgi:hypothetical protein
MCMYVCVYVCVCMCVCMFMCMYVCMYVCITPMGHRMSEMPLEPQVGVTYCDMYHNNRHNYTNYLH